MDFLILHLDTCINCCILLFTAAPVTVSVIHSHVTKKKKIRHHKKRATHHHIN